MQADIHYDDNALYCHGAWVLASLNALDIDFYAKQCFAKKQIILNLKDLEHMDTAGAWLLHKLRCLLEAAGTEVVVRRASPQVRSLLSLVSKQMEIAEPEVEAVELEDGLAIVGRRTIDGFQQTMNFFEFIGEMFVLAFSSIKYKTPLRLRALIQTIYRTGYTALPIVGLLSFLIGIVLTYQMGIQLSKYGANIYIVDLLGLSILREFGPLITAIIVSGRTASAFASEISTMKINEEIDALKTMGVAPSDIVVIPKILGLVIALPLLCVWADIWGVYGGMVMSHWYLNVNCTDFFNHFHQYIPIKHFLVGLSKTPVFAVVIACVGCFQGLRVSGGAEAVGWTTTKSVVQAIFLIIIVDAAFSILYSYLRI